MPKKNESTSNEATKIKIEVNVYVHSDRGLLCDEDVLLVIRFEKVSKQLGGRTVLEHPAHHDL